MVEAPARRPRRYDSSGRRARAAESRRRVVVEAYDRFVAHGYAGTTVADVARAAGVSAPTVFAAFGSKVALLRICIDAALTGDEDLRRLGQWVHETQDAVELLGRYAVLMGALAERAAPIYDVMVRAADAEPELAALQADFEEQRLRAADLVVDAVRRRGGLPDTRSVQDARDVVWALNAPELYVTLTRRRGWTTAQYVAWARESLVKLVVGAPLQGAPPRP